MVGTVCIVVVLDNDIDGDDKYLAVTPTVLFLGRNRLDNMATRFFEMCSVGRSYLRDAKDQTRKKNHQPRILL